MDILEPLCKVMQGCLGCEIVCKISETSTRKAKLTALAFSQDASFHGLHDRQVVVILIVFGICCLKLLDIETGYFNIR